MPFILPQTIAYSCGESLPSLKPTGPVSVCIIDSHGTDQVNLRALPFITQRIVFLSTRESSELNFFLQLALQCFIDHPINPKAVLG